MRQATSTPEPDSANAQPETPGLEASIHTIGSVGSATISSAKETGRALRELIHADLCLARSAFGRGLAWICAAVVFGTSCWLLLIGAAIALLQRTGMSWLQAMFFTALISLMATGLAIWRVVFFFDHIGMHATRRQLASLGLFANSNGEKEADARATKGEGERA